VINTHTVYKTLETINTDPVTSENGSYSTYLFTDAIEKAIADHNTDKGPFFIHAAYQAVLLRIALMIPHVHTL